MHAHATLPRKQSDSLVVMQLAGAEVRAQRDGVCRPARTPEIPAASLLHKPVLHTDNTFQAGFPVSLKSKVGALHRTSVSLRSGSGMLVTPTDKY
jgi:hypothetical protein